MLQHNGQIRETIEALAPWFHNLHLAGEQTAPDHFLGDYPASKWANIRTCLPATLEGKTVLDIGCNAGFYSLEMKRRGASRVLGLDSDEHYLRQARWAAEVSQLNVEFRKLNVYEIDRIEESFDLVIFMGVFYHLRYPLFALDKVVRKVRGRLLFQTMLRPFPEHVESAPIAPEYGFEERDVFHAPEMPRMHRQTRGFRILPERRPCCAARGWRLSRTRNRRRGFASRVMCIETANHARSTN